MVTPHDSITVSVGVMPFLSLRYYYKILLPMDKFACLKIDLCLVDYYPSFVVTRFKKSLMTSRKKRTNKEKKRGKRPSICTFVVAGICSFAVHLDIRSPPVPLKIWNPDV
ncbi:hypothetical protein GQX74_000248 [Glossina fuscipes]|nr:hypothetical protein GQX74_000248 [Glossina fuscipes]